MNEKLRPANIEIESGQLRASQEGGQWPSFDVVVNSRLEISTNGTDICKQKGTNSILETRLLGAKDS